MAGHGNVVTLLTMAIASLAFIANSQPQTTLGSSPTHALAPTLAPTKVTNLAIFFVNIFHGSPPRAPTPTMKLPPPPPMDMFATPPAPVNNAFQKSPIDVAGPPTDPVNDIKPPPLQVAGAPPPPNEAPTIYYSPAPIDTSPSPIFFTPEHYNYETPIYWAPSSPVREIDHFDDLDEDHFDDFDEDRIAHSTIH